MAEESQSCFLCGKIGISEIKNNLPEVQWPSLAQKQKKRKLKNDPTSREGVFSHFLTF
jgi:hypothetical protein